MLKNTNYYYLSDDIQTVPASKDLTGTISTSGKAVTGVGTKFLAEFKALNSWLVDLSQSYICKVMSVESDTLMHISEPFPMDISPGTTPNGIISNDLGIVAISVVIPGGSAAGKIDGQTFPVGICQTFEKASKNHSAARDLIDPIVADATSTNMMILIMR